MGEIITMISGKGGAGKTTLALGLATYLSKLELKTLLIDCDLTTHGASLVLRNHLIQANLSIHKILSGQYTPVDKNEIDTESSAPESTICQNNDNDSENITITQETEIQSNSEAINNVEKIKNLSQIHNDLYFISSVIDLNVNSEQYNYDYLNTFITYVQKIFDVIILDCQAGENTLLKNLVKKSDINLFVLEPDTASYNALNNLQIRIKETIQYKKNFMVFNKSDAKTKPNKLNIFKVLPSIKYCNDIRRAINDEDFPDENSSPDFIDSVLNICKELFPNNPKIEATDNLLIQIINRRKVELNTMLAKEKEQQKREIRVTVISSISFFLLCIISIILHFQLQPLHAYDAISIPMNYEIWGLIIISGISIVYATYSFFKTKSKESEITTELHSLDENLRKHQKQEPVN